MKILIWSGYHKTWLSKTVWETKGTGGTEYCAIKLAEALVRKGHDVVVSGTVDNEVKDGVHYIHLEDLKRHQSPITFKNRNDIRGYDHYDIVIAQQYIHYFKELERKKITFNKSLFRLHNEDTWYNWYRGKVMPRDGVEYLYRGDMNGIVCVSDLHANIFKEKLKALDNTKRKFNTYIHSIDNAIDLDDWNSNRPSKIKGRIIWSSAPDRGLKTILDNWSDWRKIRPDLSLVIACPPYSDDWDKGNYKQDGVELVGSLKPSLLRQEQMKAEYWIYQSDYLETYCITALEMMMARVKIITNGTGNIINLMNGGDNGTIIDNNPDTIIDTLKNDIDDRTTAMRMFKCLDKAESFARENNWDVRVNEWLELIDSV